MTDSTAITPRVAIEQLVHSYREAAQPHTVLNNVSLTLARGETLALRGRSGSGKSTLLNLVAGIDTPDSGAVIVDGRNVTAMNERERTLFRRRHIGFVYQAFNLVPTLTVADNVRLVLELNDVPAREAQARVAELLGAVGLGDRGDSYPERLSGGEQQRVAIARALVHRPALLLADEPTGNLDDSSADTVLALMQALRAEEGASMIMATHSAAVAATCDRVLELRAGRLSEPA